MSDSGAQPVAAQEAIEAFVDANDEQCSHFITSTFPSETALSDFARTSKRPWVTATWAQSLDGRIASLPGQPRLLISGQESMQMTFRLRQRHDVILISQSTLAADNSQLSVRNIPEDQIKKQPRPVVIDRDLLSPPSCRLFASGRSPVIFFSGATDWASADPKLSKRAGALSGAGAHLQPLEPDHFNMNSVLECLKATFDIQSVLIEPGLRMIPRLLCPPTAIAQTGTTRLADMVFITTGSTVIGAAGRTPDWSPVQSDQQQGAPAMEFVGSAVVGKDTVSALRVL